MHLAGIYKITHTTSGKFYVGSSQCVPKRLYEHFRTLKQNKHRNRKLQRAFNKYGEGAFIAETILSVLDVSALIKFEQHFLDTLRPAYNIALCAEAVNRGRVFSAQHRANLGKARKGKPLGAIHSEEFKAKQRVMKTGAGNAMYGKTHTPEVKRIISEASRARLDRPETQAALALGRGWNKGMPLSDEWRQKLSDAKPKMPVIRTNLDTGQITYYPSISAVQSDGFSKSCVSACCKGLQKLHRGCHWAYAS